MPTANDNQTARCAGCGSTAEPSMPVRRHIAPHNLIAYTQYHCGHCDLEFWWPLKADPSVYAEEGFEAYVDYHAGSRPFPRWAEPLFDVLPASHGSALDIGCGDGAVLARLATAGFDPHGIDLDDKSIKVAREKFGLGNVSAQTLEDYVRKSIELGRSFDLITFFEVLEHQDAPREFLAQVGSIARPGCMIAGSVPNRERFLARLDRKLSDGDLPPHHFLWFSSSALERLLSSSGFEDVKVVRIGALPYAQLLAKLNSVIDRKAAAMSRIARLMLAPLMRLFAPVAAIVPWIGMRRAPTHLFFRCRKG